MATFKIKADASFSADNIDDAFKVLSEHFSALADGNIDTKPVFETGEITIDKIKEAGG